MGRKSGSKKGGSQKLEAAPAAMKDEKEVSPAKRRRMASDSASPSTTDAAATLATVADAAHVMAAVANSVNNSRRNSLATVSMTVEDTEAENGAASTNGGLEALGNSVLTTNSIPDISLAARKSFADILQGLQGSDISSILSIAAQAAKAQQQVRDNEALARKSVDAGLRAANSAAATEAGGPTAAAAAATPKNVATEDAAAMVAAQMLRTQMMQASDMASITAQANAAAAEVAGSSNGSAGGPRRGRRSNPGPISGFAAPAMIGVAAASNLAASNMFAGQAASMQTLMSSILQPSPATAATPATPATGVFSTAMAKEQLAAHTAHAQSEVSDTMKRQDRLEKNRKAAKQCRLKKKEYQRCLEERVKLLEARQAELMEELLSINSNMSQSDLEAVQQRIREKYQQPIAALPQAPPDTPQVRTPRPAKTAVVGIPGTAILTANAVSPTEQPASALLAQLRTATA